jgi:antitoxin PrlF
MELFTSRITAKGQTTIPIALRKDLRLAEGDELIFEREGDKVILRKATHLDVAYYRAIQSGLASDWDSADDNEAYNGL